MLLCPLCARSLKTVERDGVEIDHCTGCGGFWLDQGELDRLVKQEAQIALQAGQQALSLARRNREYDHAAVSAEERDSTGGMTGATGANRVLREAAAAVSARF
ncbi:MAG: zf-TFIIB domain-containing protein [Cytophagales bacterium]|nr:zf-TFIIB domain-containing protein [Armatimonadota bacterium]